MNLSGDAASWVPNLSISLKDAPDLQSLLEALALRYGLLGGVIANEDGSIRAQTGGAVQDLKELATAIDVSVLPRYYANGPFDAYVDLVGGGMMALLMRERPANVERTELSMISDYAVAKEMMGELKTGISRIQHG